MSSWNRNNGTFSGETVSGYDRPRVNTQGGGSNPGTYRLYGYQITADPTRTLVSVTLPADRNVVIMALGFGTNNQVVVPGTYVYTYKPGNLSAPGDSPRRRHSCLRSTWPSRPTTRPATTVLPAARRISGDQGYPRFLTGPRRHAIPAKGTPLSGIQLDATATSQGSAPLPGNFLSTPLLVGPVRRLVQVL